MCPGRPEVRDYYLNQARRFQDSMNLLHDTNHIIQMLQAVVDVNLIECLALQGIWEHVEVVDYVGGCSTVEIDPQGAEALLIPASEVE
jgi:hypothetical protein